MKKAQIIGTGYYVPENVVTNFDLMKIMDTSDEWITTKIGIKERRITSGDELTSDMAAKAAKMAIKNADISSEEIDMILLATNFPDHISPATSVMIQKKIGAKNAFAFDIRTGGCPGSVFSLSVASKYIADGTCKTILVAAGDLNSKGLDWEDRSTAVIFGDGASAIIYRLLKRKKWELLILNCIQILRDIIQHIFQQVVLQSLLQKRLSERKDNILKWMAERYLTLLQWHFPKQ